MSKCTRSGTSLLAWICAALLSVVYADLALADNPAGLLSKAATGPGLRIDHSAWDRLLKQYVQPGADGLNRIDYKAFQSAGHADLKMYISALQRVDMPALSRSGQFALLANLYNAMTIDIVLDHYPVKSIKDISLGGGIVATFTGGPWKAEVLTLMGRALSLDDIEHDLLRPVFKDARVHYAVNCASVGCPNMQTEAFTAEKLDAQLDAAARRYVNHPRAVRVSGHGIVVSSIYHWFKDDFGGDDAGVLAHLTKYAAPELSASLKRATALSGHVYDWSLNDIAR